MKKCPFCAEEIQDDAKVCRFCSRVVVLKSSMSPQAKRRLKEIIFTFTLLFLIMAFSTYMEYLSSLEYGSDETKLYFIWVLLYGLTVLGLAMRKKVGYYLAWVATIPFFFTLLLIPLGIRFTNTLKDSTLKAEFGFIA